MQTPRPGRLRSLPIFARGSLSGTRLISCERRGGRDETLSLSSAGRPAIRHAAVRRERGCVAGLVTAAWIELCAVCRRRQPGSCARLTLACPPFRAAGYCLQPLRGWPVGMRIQFLQHQFRQKGGQRQVVGRVPPVALPCRTVLLRPGERPARRVTLRACAPDARPLSRVGHSRAGRPSLDTAVLLGGGVRGQAAWSIRMPHCRQVALLWPPPTKPRWSISPVGGGGRCGAAAAALVAQESVVRPSTPPPPDSSRRDTPVWVAHPRRSRVGLAARPSARPPPPNTSAALRPTDRHTADVGGRTRDRPPPASPCRYPPGRGRASISLHPGTAAAPHFRVRPRSLFPPPAPPLPLTLRHRERAFRAGGCTGAGRPPSGS